MKWKHHKNQAGNKAKLKLKGLLLLTAKVHITEGVVASVEYVLISRGTYNREVKNVKCWTII